MKTFPTPSKPTETITEKCPTCSGKLVFVGTGPESKYQKIRALGIQEDRYRCADCGAEWIKSREVKAESEAAS